MPFQGSVKTATVGSLACLFTFVLAVDVSVQEPAREGFPDYTLTTWNESDGLPASRVWELVQGPEGYIWLGTETGLVRFDGVRFTAWADLGRDPLPKDEVLSLLSARDGSLWAGFGGAGGAARIQGTQVTIFRSNFPGKGRVLSLAEDETGDLWAVAHSGVYRFRNGEWDSAERLPVSPEAPPLTPELSAAVGDLASEVLHDRVGSTWVGTPGGGLWRSSVGPDGPVLDHGLSSESVLSLLEDREGSVWVGTQSGLSRLTRRRVQPLTSLGRNVTVVSAESGGSVWVGTNRGLLEVQDAYEEYPTEIVEWLSSSVSALHVDEHHTVWTGTAAGLSRLGEGQLDHIATPGGGSAISITAIDSGPDGTVWLSELGNGVYQWTGKELVPFPSPEPTPPAYSLFVDDLGRVWVGFAGGVLGSIDKNGRYELFRSDTTSTFRFIYPGVDDTLWIAGTGGLTRFENGSFVTVDRSNGLPGDAITGIVGDEDGYLWLGASLGVFRLHGSEVAKVAADPRYQVDFTVYDTSDGLAGPPIWLGNPTVSRGPEGRLWFVTGRGLTSVDPRSLPDPIPEAPLLIESIAVDEQSFAATQDLVLPPRPTRLEINYTALAFSSAAKLRFRYRLEGFDDGWVEGGARRTAVYTNLPPGDYRFQVIANDGRHPWNDTGPVWSFSVQPTFYQTAWFQSLTIIVFLAALVGAWHLNNRMAQRRFALVLGERTRVSREIHDTLLQSMVGLTLQLDDLSQAPDLATETKSRLAVLRGEVKEHIQEAKRSILDLRNPSTEIGGLASRLLQTGNEVTKNSSVRFDFELQGEPRRYASEVEEQVLRIAREAMTNTVRHADARRVHAVLTCDDHEVRLTIADDGRGFASPSTTDPGSLGWGLTGMRERAESLGGTLNVKSTSDEGTVVELHVTVSGQA